MPILVDGLQRPGDKGVEIAHGQNFSPTARMIYLRPSIEYAGHPVYAEFFRLDHRDWPVHANVSQYTQSPR